MISRGFLVNHLDTTKRAKTGGPHAAPPVFASTYQEAVSGIFGDSLHGVWPAVTKRRKA